MALIRYYQIIDPDHPELKEFCLGFVGHHDLPAPLEGCCPAFLAAYKVHSIRFSGIGEREPGLYLSPSFGLPTYDRLLYCPFCGDPIYGIMVKTLQARLVAVERDVHEYFDPESGEVVVPAT